jgi:hypothetical protein
MRFVISNDVCISVTLVDDASSKTLIQLEAPSLFVALYCNGVPCAMKCFWLIVGGASIAFLGCVLASRTMLKLDFLFWSTMHVGQTLTSFNRLACSMLVEMQYQVVSRLLFLVVC